MAGINSEHTNHAVFSSPLLLRLS